MTVTLTQIASVTSGGTPQPGQSHRSSGNFSTEQLPAGTTGLQWEVSGTENPGAVTFDVMEDKTAAIDPTIFAGVKSGKQTEIYSARRLYIANPAGSQGGNFVVTVYAIT